MAGLMKLMQGRCGAAQVMPHNNMPHLVGKINQPVRRGKKTEHGQTLSILDDELFFLCSSITERKSIGECQGVRAEHA